MVSEGSPASNVPHAVVHPLSEKLNGWLRTVLFSCWHVQVVHKNDTLLPHGRTKDTLATFVQLGHD